MNGKYLSAVIISGLVAFIAVCPYFRIFNSWVQATGVFFNDAYRYMDCRDSDAENKRPVIWEGTLRAK